MSSSCGIPTAQSSGQCFAVFAGSDSPDSEMYVVCTCYKETEYENATCTNGLETCRPLHLQSLNDIGDVNTE